MLTREQLLTLHEKKGPELHKLISFVVGKERSADDDYIYNYSERFDKHKKGVLQILYDPALTFAQRLNLLEAITQSERYFAEVLAVLLTDFESRKFTNYYIPKEMFGNASVHPSTQLKNLVCNLYLPLYNCLMGNIKIVKIPNDIVDTLKDNKWQKMFPDVEEEIPIFENQDTQTGYKFFLTRCQQVINYGKIVDKKTKKQFLSLLKLTKDRFR